MIAQETIAAARAVLIEALEKSGHRSPSVNLQMRALNDVIRATTNPTPAVSELIGAVAAELWREGVK